MGDRAVLYPIAMVGTYIYTCVHRIIHRTAHPPKKSVLLHVNSKIKFKMNVAENLLDWTKFSFHTTVQE